MNDTGSYTARKNAKRAAEKMIADGKAPAVDYAIRPRDDARFEIIWKATRAEEVEAELTAAIEAAATGHSGSATEPEPAATSDSEPAAAASTRTEPQSAEAEDPFPAGTWVKVRKGKRNAIVGQVTSASTRTPGACTRSASLRSGRNWQPRRSCTAPRSRHPRHRSRRGGRGVARRSRPQSRRGHSMRSTPT